MFFNKTDEKTIFKIGKNLFVRNTKTPVIKKTSKLPLVALGLVAVGALLKVGSKIHNNNKKLMQDSNDSASKKTGHVSSKTEDANQKPVFPAKLSIVPKIKSGLSKLEPLINQAANQI